MFPFFFLGDLELKSLLNIDFSSIVNRSDKYFSPSNLSSLTANLTKNDLFLTHFNVRSLSKNKTKMHKLINLMVTKPNVIAISEIKLNPNSVSNVNLSNYKFFRNDSPTNAGGVGLYINEAIKCHLRNDLFLNLDKCEDLWLEIECKVATFILAVIYRHPNQDLTSFHNKFYNQLKDLENKKINNVVSGDFNTNILAKDNPSIGSYVNDLTSIGCSSRINVPIRFADNCKSSLLDHIYSDILKKDTASGVCVFEISDHLPTFFAAKNTKCSYLHITMFKRSMKNFKIEDYLLDLDSAFSSINITDLNKSNISQGVSGFPSTFNSVSDKHAPLTALTKKEKRLKKKPWITPGTLASIKTKNKLSKKVFKKFH